MSRGLRHAAIASLLTLLAGCQKEVAPLNATSASAQAAAEAAPITLPPIGDYRLLEVHLGNAVDAEGRVREALAVFAATDTLHVSVVGSATTAALTLSVRWLDAGGHVIAESEQAVLAGPASVASFQLAHPQGWPTGAYRVELAVNGQIIDFRTFEVR